LHTPDADVPSNGVAPAAGAGGTMNDFGWLFLVFVLFVLARALVRLCERLM
jgi:hypothetical protein